MISQKERVRRLQQVVFPDGMDSRPKFTYRYIAEKIEVSVPAVRKWILGEGFSHKVPEKRFQQIIDLCS